MMMCLFIHSGVFRMYIFLGDTSLNTIFVFVSDLSAVFVIY